MSHSDAGSEYTSIAFTQRLVDAGVDPSVGSVGDAFYNALVETTVGSYKTELIRRCGPWRDVGHVEIETLHWVDWFNTERPHDYLNDLTPKRDGVIAVRLGHRLQSDLGTALTEYS